MLDLSTHRCPSKEDRPRRRTFSPIVKAALATSVFALSATPSFAQDTPTVPTENPSLNLNLSNTAFRDISDLNALSDLSGPMIDLPVDAVGSTLFKLDLTDPGCLSGSNNCNRRSDRVSLGLSEYITAKKDDGIDLVLRPRASFRFDDDSSSALVGAVVEIGEDLRQGSDIKTNTWYLFAGADAEALTYSPESLRALSSGNFHLQDRIIVGDAQAGLGYRIGDADVSLSYLRRQANAEGLSYNEDAAALSFTWKR